VNGDYTILLRRPDEGAFYAQAAPLQVVGSMEGCVNEHFTRTATVLTAGTHLGLVGPLRGPASMIDLHRFEHDGKVFVEVGTATDEFYFCLHCGVITHIDHWTLWQPDGDHEFGEADYRPHGLREHDSDALLKCPACGQMHGDGYVGDGIEDGTLGQCEEARRSMLAEEGTAEMWAEVLSP
jgi:hypothetical protein